MAHLHRLIALLLFFVAAHAQALSPNWTWIGSKVVGPFNSYGQCLSVQKSAWDAEYSSYVGCRTWTDTPIRSVGGDVEGGSALGGCAGGGVSCRATTATACPARSTLTIDSSGGYICQCEAGLREQNGQCTDQPPDCATGSVWDDLAKACVVKPCAADEVRVNGICVKEPPCEPGETRINGVCKKNGCQPGTALGSYATAGDAVSFYCDSYGGTNCVVRVYPSVCVTIEGRGVECAGTGRLTGAQCSAPKGLEGPTTGGSGNSGNSGNSGSGNSGSGNSGNSGSGNSGSGNSGNSGSGNSMDLPQPAPKPPAEDGTCPSRYSRMGNLCIQDPGPPDGDGKCPEGMVRAGNMCYASHPPSGGGGGNPGGGGDGNGGGDGQSGFGGSCRSGFACEGDAIQCAIAKEQHRRACTFFEDSTPESDLYGKEKGKEGSQVGNLPGNETINLAGRISSVDVLGVAPAGLRDLQLTVWRQSVTLPLSILNPYLVMLGNVLLAVSFLIAARIIVRG